MLLLAPLLVAALGQVGPAQAAEPQGPTWCTVGGLLRPEHGVGITAYDVASDGVTLAMTDGIHVWRTDDGGCTWDQLTPDAVGEASAEQLGYLAPGRVVSLAVTSSSVHALLMDGSSLRASTVRIASWREESGTWQEPTVPPQIGAERAIDRCDGQLVCRLVRARGESGVLHLLVSSGPERRTLWRSIDDGVTFSPVVDGADMRLDVTSLAPMDGDELGLAGVGACKDIVRRTTVGVDWRTIPHPGAGSNSVLGVAYSGRNLVAALGDPGGCGASAVTALAISDDHGTEFETVPVDLGALDSIALDRSGETTVVVHSGGSAHFLEGATLHKIIVPDGLNVSDARMIEADVRYVALLTAEGVFVADTSTVASGLREGASTAKPCSSSLPPTPSTRGGFTVDPESFSLDIGDNRAVPVSAMIEGASLPVDVVMLFDTSGSMSPAIRSMSRSILRASRILGEAGYDSRVALAQFSDINIAPYDLLVPLAAPGCELVRALERIYPGGGAEAHLLALHQAVTGSGWPAAGVPAGQGGGFRSDVSRLVVMLSDESINRRMPQAPSWDETVSAMRQANVKHVGIRVLDATEIEQPGLTDPVRADMDELGIATDSLAPPGGLDCNGDGFRDLAEGDPMTCSYGGPAAASGINDAELGDLLVQIIAASVTSGDARLEVDAPEGIDASLTGTRVSVQAGGAAPLEDLLSVSCEARARGDVTVRLMFGSADLASMRIPVTCGTVVAAAPPAIPDVRQPIPLPPPPPPAIVSVGQTVSSQAQAQSHATSSALAPSSQRQPVLAYARRSLRTEPGLMLAAGALSLTAAAAAQRRRQLELARQEQR